MDHYYKWLWLWESRILSRKAVRSLASSLEQNYMIAEKINKQITPQVSYSALLVPQDFGTMRLCKDLIFRVSMDTPLVLTNWTLSDQTQTLHLVLNKSVCKGLPRSRPAEIKSTSLLEICLSLKSSEQRRRWQGRKRDRCPSDKHPSSSQIKFITATHTNTSLHVDPL